MRSTPADANVLRNGVIQRGIFFSAGCQGVINAYSPVIANRRTNREAINRTVLSMNSRVIFPILA